MSETQMVKNGRVEPGKTPTKTGKPCHKVVNGEPVRDDEEKQDDEFEKLAASIHVN